MQLLVAEVVQEIMEPVEVEVEELQTDQFI
jgi:hypothetical protein